MENGQGVLDGGLEPMELTKESVRETYYWYSVCLDGQDICSDKGWKKIVFSNFNL